MPQLTSLSFAIDCGERNCDMLLTCQMLADMIDKMENLRSLYF